MSANPVVLCISGHDPSGGAGIQADIEAIISHGCHPTSVITALTEQDSSNVKAVIPQPPTDFANQANTLITDISINAIKIGLLANSEIALAVNTVIAKLPGIPVVLDPVLAAGGGKDLSSADLITILKHQLLPNVTVLTPNSEEARKLTGLQDLHDCGLALLDLGCDYVLITGSHENTEEVINQLFHQGQCINAYRWQRLPHSYHGSGCTLAASIAALLAQGLNVPDAIAQAQEYTWNALVAGFKAGKGQHFPGRLYWRSKP